VLAIRVKLKIVGADLVGRDKLIVLFLDNSYVVALKCKFK
jgi:hypothetical protein